MMVSSSEVPERHHGKIVSLAKDGGLDLSCAYEIETLLSIDVEFTAEKNLVIELIELLELLPVTDKSKAWLETLLVVKQQGEKNQWSLHADTRSSGNPLGGRIDKYPILAFLLQKAHTAIHEQSLRIKVLFLYCLINDNENHKLDTAAATLRRAISPRTNKITLIKAFPKFVSFNEVLAGFKALLSHQAFKKAMVSDKEFYDALKKISDTQLPESNPKPLPSPTIAYPPTVEDELNWTVTTSIFFEPNYPNEPQQLPFTFIKISDDEDEGVTNFDPQSLDEEG